MEKCLYSSFIIIQIFSKEEWASILEPEHEMGTLIISAFLCGTGGCCEAIGVLPSAACVNGFEPVATCT